MLDFLKIKRTILRKLMVGFILVSLLVGVVGYVSIKTFQQVTERYKFQSLKIMPSLKALHDLKAACLRINSSVNEYGFIFNEMGKPKDSDALRTEIRLIENGTDQFVKALRMYREMVRENYVEDSLFVRMNAIADGYLQTSKAIIGMKNDGQSGEAVLEMKESLERDEIELIKMIDVIIGMKTAQENSSNTILLSTLEKASGNILLIGTLTLLSGILLGIVVSKSISKPLIQLKDAVTDFGEGKLESAINVRSSDEVGVLENAFNEMIIRLRTSRKELTLEKLHFQQLFENTPFGIVMLDPSGAVTGINKSFEKMFQYTLDEIKGRNIDDVIIPAELAAEAMEMTEKVMCSQIVEKETVRKRKDGSTLTVHHLGIPGTIDGITSGGFAIYEDITNRIEAEKQREALITELREAMANISTLSGLLPICASCKKIRDDQGYWQQVEGYIMKHTDATFTHGICPDCAKTFFPEVPEK